MKHNQAEAYVIPGDLQNRLANWTRWATGRRWFSATCWSVEGRFRPEAGNVWEEAVHCPQPLDILDAWAVECTWRTALPLRERAILRAYFILDYHPSRVGYMLRIRRSEVAREVYRASMMLRNSLPRDRLAA